MKRTPVFPVLAIDPKGSFIGLPSAKYLETASPTALRNGYFERLYLYDSAGERWPIAEATPMSAPRHSVLGRVVDVRLTFGAPEAASTASIAEVLCSLIDLDPDDLYDQWISHEELKRRLRASHSSEELISIATALGAQTA